MRICITGSHSTGKSTLVVQCYEALTQACPGGVDMIPETARRLIAKGVGMAKDTGCDAAMMYIGMQLEAERRATQRHVVADRSVLDLLAYLRVNRCPEVPACLLRVVEEVVWLETDYFDVYCYLPVEFEMTLDAARPEDEAYRLEIDQCVLETLQEFGLNYSVVRGSSEDRLSQVLAAFGFGQ